MVRFVFSTFSFVFHDQQHNLNAVNFDENSPPFVRTTMLNMFFLGILDRSNWPKFSGGFDYWTMFFGGDTEVNALLMFDVGGLLGDFHWSSDN